MTTPKPKRAKPRKPREWWLVVRADGYTVGHPPSEEHYARRMALLWGGKVFHVREVLR